MTIAKKKNHHAKVMKSKIIGYKFDKDGNKITVYAPIDENTKRKIKCVSLTEISFSDLSDYDLNRL